jgi:hypothetical protein
MIPIGKIEQKAYMDFILEKSVFYSDLPEMLTKQQFAVIKAF